MESKIWKELGLANQDCCTSLLKSCGGCALIFLVLGLIATALIIGAF
jgi:hypothetical protein